MSGATCIIPNCGRQSPAAEPFCAHHRAAGRGDTVDNGADSIIRALMVALPNPGAKSGKFFDLRTRAEAWLKERGE